MTDILAVFNAGSSTLKFSIFRRDDLSLLHKGLADVDGGEDGHARALDAALGWIDAHESTLRLTCAGHRVVHGKDRAAPVRITPEIVKELKSLIPLAPLHQPYNLKIIEALTRHNPDLPQLACFDTAFHHTLPPLATRFAIARALHDEGVRRYGFHGISYDYIASELPGIAGSKAHGRVIVAHLGNGASLCAMQNLKSQATSMGFSTLDGLMMGTRCGALDPGVALYLQQHSGLPVEAVSELLYHRSGLLGVSGISADMRILEASEAPAAAEAIALFSRMAAQQIGGLVAMLGGLDILVFTGGIGEHSARIRSAISAYLGYMGLTLDDASNTRNATRLHAQGSAVSAYVIPTNEEIVIARACKI